MSVKSQIAPVKLTLEDVEINEAAAEHSDSANHRDTLDAELSTRLVSLVRKDSAEKLAAELEAARIPADSLPQQRLTFFKPDGGVAEVFRLHHLAVHYSAKRTLAFLISKSLGSGGCCWQSLGALDDSDGSNLLHTLAKTRVLRENRGSELSKTELEGVDQFEKFVLEALAEVGLPDCGCDKESATCCGLPVGDEKPKSLLHALCLMENSAGLRPLEFAMQIGAYSTFQRIAEVDNYLKVNEQVIGIRVYKRYNLSEYDVISGVRRNKAPILMLNEIRFRQVPALRRSTLMQPGRLVDKWIDLIYCDLKWAYLLSQIYFGILFFNLTPLSANFVMMVTMTQHAFELDKGFYEFAKKIKAAYSELNVTNIEAEVRLACHPDNLVKYLSNGSQGDERLKTSPIYFYSVTREAVMKSITANHYLMALILLAQLAILLFGIVAVSRSKRSPLYSIDKCFDMGGEYFKRNDFMTNLMIAMLACGLLHLSGSLVLIRSLDCTDFVMGRSTYFSNSWVTILTEVSAVMYMFFAMLCFTAGFELKFKRFAFLGICFRKMFSRFLAAVPLFFIWAYFVFGTLFFMVDFDKSEFQSQFSVFYSPLRIFLNTASLTPSRPSTAILHTLFVLIITINIQNFLIAYVSNAFNSIAANFELVHQLTRFDHVAIIWLMWAELIGHWRRLTHRFRQSKSSRQLVETMEISFPELE